MCYNIFGKRQEDLLCYTKAAVFLGAFSSFCPNRMGQNRILTVRKNTNCYCINNRRSKSYERLY